MKDKEAIFQLPFIAEGVKSSQPNDKSFSAKRFIVRRRTK